MRIGVTQEIATFINDIGYRSIPQQAINIAKNAVRDCIGVAIAGANEPVVKLLTNYVKEVGARNEAGVICGGFKTTADLAAWVNGSISHNLDYDDSFPNSIGYNFHPTVGILPAILALAETCKFSGKDVLTAYICGVEIEFSLGSVIGTFSSELGWHPTAVLGVMGAVGASAKLLGLNDFQIKMAIGIASSLAGGLMRNTGSMTKSLHAGNTARNGVLASLLAKKGFTGNENILEGTMGFCQVFSGARVSPSIDEVFELGDDWRIVSTGIAFKPYPCCRGTHSSIEAALYLREKYAIRPEDINTVTSKTSPMIPKLLPYHHPRKGLEGKFSLEYCVATSLLRGKPRLEDFSDERVNDPQIQALLPRISYIHPKGWVEGPQLPQEVVIRLKNGIEHSCKVALPKGEPENPMTENELVSKFRNCVATFLSHEKSEHILEIICNINSIEDVSRLMDTLTFSV